jgi:hypothetical protein
VPHVDLRLILPCGISYLGSSAHKGEIAQNQWCYSCV